MVYSGTVGEVTAMNSTGWSAGFTFLYDGGLGISGGRRLAVRAIAAWTSWAAASMLRSRVKVSVTCEEPWMLTELMESMPAIVENSLSSGRATEEAMVSGLAP